MMKDWKKIRLGNACTTNADVYSPRENWSFVNYLDTGNITDNKIDSIQCIDVKNQKLPSRARRKVVHNSIIYSTVRPNQRHFGIIKSQPEHFLVSTGFAVINVDESILDADFLYYVLTQEALVEMLHAIAEQSTSAYPAIKASDIEDLEIEIPNLETQKRIAGILRSLDVKIAQNTRINHNLEQQAQTLFTNMFPNIFTESTGTVEELISFSNGKKRPNEVGHIPVYGGNGILAYTSVSNNKDCIIIGRVGAYCGSLYYSAQPCWVSDNAISAKSKDDNSQLFSYYLLKNASLPSRHIGTSQPLLTQGILNAIPCSVPNKDSINKFNEICESLQAMIDNNSEENLNLSHLRDTLLPKFMSGEINVFDIDL